jgi:hypothetical protein
MTERKVHPIKGKHQSMSSMVAECMADPKSVRGFVIYFEEDGTMHHGHFGATRSDTCMAASYLNMMAMETMQYDE